MKIIIENELSKLIGLKLTKSTRSSQLECLKFGVFEKTFRDGVYNMGQYGLHLQTAWRFIQHDRIIVASEDLFEQAENAEFDRNFVWQNYNLRDKQIKQLINSTILIVNKIIADKFGGFEIYFSNEVILQVFPANSATNEFWRLLKNMNPDEEDLIIGNSIPLSK